MARNKVQFQKGLSEARFAILYGTEEQCREQVFGWRWPSGFVARSAAGSVTAWSKPARFTSVPPVDGRHR